MRSAVTHHGLILAVIVGFNVLFVVSTPAQTVRVFSVNTTSDTVVPNSCADRQAPCSLRGAIAASNPDGDALIQFNIPPSDPFCSGGVCTINVTSTLPTLTGQNTRVAGPGASRLIVRPATGILTHVFSVNLVSGVITISGLTIKDGSGQGFAGGIHKVGNGLLEVVDTFLSNNRGLAGGIYATAGTVNIIRSTFYSNTGNLGGAVRVSDDGTCNIINSSIVFNRAGFDGGGVYSAGTTSITNSTIVLNTAASLPPFAPSGASVGGGVRSNGGVFTIKSTLIASNSSDSEDDVSGNFTSAGFNLVGKIDGSNGFTQATDLKGTNASPLNPRTLPTGLQDFGGTTPTIILQPNSPAVDKGSSSGLTGALTTDQRSGTFPRKRDNPLVPNAVGGDGTDIGATERHTFSPIFDFDGDGRTEVGIFRPSVAEWWYFRSLTGTVIAAQFGASTDKAVPADYTGDGRTDVAFWRPATGEWFIVRSDDNTYFSAPFGTSGDLPVPGNYDTDGKVDIAVFRPSTGFWFVQRTLGGTTAQQFGTNGDQPIAADYDGDGRTDVAIYRPSVGEWWLNRTSAGTIAYGFGNSTDKIVPADYTGDGKTDVAFWRPATGEWFVLRSEDTSYFSAPFGVSTDLPTPGDYDGDGKHDVTVFRPSNGTWFVNRTTGGTSAQQFGANGDVPLPRAFMP